MWYIDVITDSLGMLAALGAMIFLFRIVVKLDMKNYKGVMLLTTGLAIVLLGHMLKLPVFEMLLISSTLEILDASSETLSFLIGLPILSVGIYLFMIETHDRSEKFKENEEKYRLLFDLLPCSVSVSSKDKKVLMANNELAKMYGVESPKDIIGKFKHDFVKAHADFFREAEKREKNIFKNLKANPPLERKIIRKDGKEFYWESSSAPLPTKDGVLILSVTRDVTERRRVEELLKSVDESRKLLNEAIEIDEIRTEFFANLSHELRTPLNVILSAIQLINRHDENENYEENSMFSKYSRIITQNCLRLLRLVNNLIDSTKLQAGFSEMNIQNHNIVNVVEDITLSVAEYVKDKGINLIFDTEVEEKQMAFDADMIERIMLNLLSNAIKFTGQGGNILVRISDMSDSVQISVKDSGCGIPADKQNIIFERFRQVDKSLNRKHEGSGIGLSLVKSFVDMHNGTVSVHSELGNGSEFIVKLPVNVVEGNSFDNTRCNIEQDRRIEKINIEFSDIYT